MRAFVLLTRLLVAAMLGAGAAGAADRIVDLDGTAWTLSELAEGPSQTATLRFEGQRVSGNDGCNRYTGSFSREGESLRIGPLASTRMACPEEAMVRARAFTDTLAATRAMRIDGARLVLLDAAEVALATFVAQPDNLAGSSWQVTGYNNGRQALVSPLPGSEVTLRFTEDGTIDGSAGCNRLTVPYTQTERRIGLAEMALTRMSCGMPDGVMEQEKALLDALKSVRELTLEGDRLELRTDEGALAITARRN